MSVGARREKDSHRDTVSYEIDMLRFCAWRWSLAETRPASDRFLLLEGLLLHYRNLIRFFSGNKARRGDLSTANLKEWAGRDLNKAAIEALKEPALVLDIKYFNDISKYLAHCTLLRREPGKSWDVKTMLSEIAPIIAEFERVFPR